LAQRNRSVGLRVAKRLVEQRRAPRAVVDQLAETQRMYTALRQIERHLIFIGGLHPLHRKRFEFHGANVLYTADRVINGDRRGHRVEPATARQTAMPPPNLARIPAGEFLMGAADGEEDERPVHRVFVSEFFIGRFPVTQEEYARFVRATGYPPPAVRGLPMIA